MQMIYTWEQRHKVYCKRRCNFDGTAAELFGTWVLCMLLTIVTLGIYSFWVPLKVKRWQIKHTHLIKDDSPLSEPELAGNGLTYFLLGACLLIPVFGFAVASEFVMGLIAG